MKTFPTTLRWNQRSPSISSPAARKDGGCGLPNEVSNWWSVWKVMSFICLWVFNLAPFHFYQLSLWSIISGPLIGSNRAFPNVKTTPGTGGWVSSAFIRKRVWLINGVLPCRLLQSRQQITSWIYEMDLAFSSIVELCATVCAPLICLKWFCACWCLPCGNYDWSFRRIESGWLWPFWHSERSLNIGKCDQCSEDIK